MGQATAATKTKPNLITRYVPLLGWLPGYDRGWLRPDFLAGLTVVALLVPEGMAYAELAGMPPETAFYAAIPALLLYAVFGTSRQLVVATSSTIAAMSASIIVGLAPASYEEYIILTAALAILAGLVSIIAGLLRLGAISQFFSKSVLTGFVFGLALVIAVKQLPKLFGLEAAEGNFWARMVDLIGQIPDSHWLTFLVGLTSLVLMLILEERWPRVPAALVTLIYGIAVVSIFNLDEQGVHIVGDIPAGLSSPQLPGITFQQLLSLLPGAMAIALVAFAEAIGPARDFAAKHRYEIDANQELIAIGAANFGAGLFQGYSIGASLSKSAANENSGARSPVSLVVAAAVTALVALFLTGLFHNLPEATLAAIVIVAIKGMMNVPEMRRLYNLRRPGFWLAMVALLAVLTFEILAGLMIAVILSLLLLIAQAARPKLSVLGRDPRRIAFGDVEHHPGYHLVPGLMIIRPDEGLWFANAEPLREAIVRRVFEADRPVQSVLLDLEMTFELDIPALDMLAKLKEELERYGTTLLLTRLHHEVRELLERSGVAEQIGRDNVAESITEGILLYLESEPDLTDEETRMLIERMPHLLDFLSLIKVYAEDEEKARLDQLRERFEEIGRQVALSSGAEQDASSGV
jgi:high affinity sulfate transporter 1